MLFIHGGSEFANWRSFGANMSILGRSDAVTSRSAERDVTCRLPGKSTFEFPATMKRGRKDQLTGGTGDVNPQILTVVANQTGNDVSTVVQQPLPIPRYPTSVGRNLVMEFLAIDYYQLNQTINPANNNVNLLCVTTSPAIAPNLSAALQDPRLLDAWLKMITAPAVVADTYDIKAENYQDLTDKAGHGILVAADNLYFGVYSAATAATNAYVLKLWYRWKEVSLTEYIGIVQSQQ